MEEEEICFDGDLCSKNILVSLVCRCSFSMLLIIILRQNFKTLFLYCDLHVFEIWIEDGQKLNQLVYLIS